MSNNDAHKWIGEKTFSLNGKAFAILLALTVVQKYLSILINGFAVSGAAAGKATSEQIEKRGEAFKFDPVALIQLMRSTVWFIPGFVKKRLFLGILKGNFMGSARATMRMMQIQALIVVAIVCLLVKVACSIAWH